jgi:hypothetical protein
MTGTKMVWSDPFFVEAFDKNQRITDKKYLWVCFCFCICKYSSGTEGKREKKAVRR